MSNVWAWTFEFGFERCCRRLTATGYFASGGYQLWCRSYAFGDSFCRRVAIVAGGLAALLRGLHLWWLMSLFLHIRIRVTVVWVTVVLWVFELVRYIVLFRVFEQHARGRAGEYRFLHGG